LAGLPSPVPLDLARPGAVGGDAPGHAGHRAGRHRGLPGRAAGSRRRLLRRGRARRHGAAAAARPGRGPGPRAGRPQVRPAALRAAAVPGLLGPAAGRHHRHLRRPRGGIPDGRIDTMKIAMISEHASPLAAIGGVDAGGQNVHVAALSTALARRGHQVTVYTRRDDPQLPERVPVSEGFEVVHVAAGPPRPLSKDLILPYMSELAQGAAADWAADPPEVIHAHFWMSGVAALEAARAGGHDIPVVQTF